MHLPRVPTAEPRARQGRGVALHATPQNGAAPRRRGKRAPSSPSAPWCTPATLHAEASVLGGVLVRPEILGQLAELEVEDFFSPKHQAVFAAMREIERRAQPIDVVTVEVELERQERIEAVGGVAFLGQLAATVPVPEVEHVVQYAHEVRAARFVRDVRILLSEVTDEAVHKATTGPELVQLARTGLDRLAELHLRGGGQAAQPRWFEPLAATLSAEPDDDDGADWIIRDVVPRGAAWLWAAPSTAGKSWVAIDLGIAIARGENWLGDGTPNTLGRPGRVLLVMMEDGERQLRRRLWDLCRGRGITPNDKLVAENLRITRHPLRWPGPDLTRFLAEARAWQPDVVVIDTLTRSMIGDPNSTRDATAYTQPWVDLCRELGAAIGVLHHLAKTDEAKARGKRSLFDRIRGSGEFFAAVRHAVASEPFDHQDGPISLVEVRSNLDAQRLRWALGFDRKQDPSTGRWSARLVDRGDPTLLAKDAREAARKLSAKEERAVQEQRRNKAVELCTKHGSVSGRKLAEAIETAPRTADKVLEALARDGVLRFDKRVGYVFAEGAQ